MKKIMVSLLLVLVALFSPAWGSSYDNSAALAGLQTPKVYFDVNQGDAKKLLVRLDLLDRTIRQMTEAGLRPEVVVGIRGGATKLMTRGTGYFREEDIQFSEPIRKWVADFKARGFVLEQCAIAMEFLKVEAGDMLPEINIVANGYVSMIGYQNRGYAVVPMD